MIPKNLINTPIAKQMFRSTPVVGAALHLGRAVLEESFGE